MDQVKFLITGLAPLLIHSNKAANPINNYAKALKPLTSKRNKTDADYLEIARLEWEAGLYLHDGEVVIPGDNIDKCMLLGARKTKNGVKWETGAFIDEEFCALDYEGQKIRINGAKIIPNPELDKFYPKFSDLRMVRVNKTLVPRCRPIFHGWSFNFTVLYDESVIDERTIQTIASDAGRLVGLCERRPRLGKFEAVKV
jgi:hypothetical protein